MKHSSQKELRSVCKSAWHVVGVEYIYNSWIWVFGQALSSVTNLELVHGEWNRIKIENVLFQAHKQLLNNGGA